MMRKIKKLWERDEVTACKLCGTPLKEGKLTCPLCGYLTGAESNVFVIPGGQGGREKEKDARPITAAPTKEMPERDPEDGGESGVEVVLVEEEGEAAMGVREELDVAAPVFTVDPPGLRELLAKQPELLEPGLRIVTDKSGKPVGAGFSTAVGDIDLLARDGSGAFVVVMVAGRGEGEKLVAETLQRVGWVRKHLGKGKQRVRGVVLVEEAPENLSYAAAAVADTVRFKTYRVGLTLGDVEI